MSLDFRADPGGIVTDPRFWASSQGYEFWAVFGHLDAWGTVMAATNDGLSGYGWNAAIAATASITEGSAGDFLSSADIDPTRLVRGSTNTALKSPRVFGSYDHGLQAARFLGGMPTKLTMECYARMSVASANETTAFIGLLSGTDAAAAGGGGAITSDSANFLYVSDTATDAGAAIDTNWHVFKITWSATVEWWIDGVSQGSGITLMTDIWPLAFSIGDAAAGTNRPQVSWVRMYYEL